VIRQSIPKKIWAQIVAASLMLVVMLIAQPLRGQTLHSDDPGARPPLSKADVRIVLRAREILNSPSNWNRADTRDCPTEAKTFSLLRSGKGYE